MIKNIENIEQVKKDGPKWFYTFQKIMKTIKNRSSMSNTEKIFTAKEVLDIMNESKNSYNLPDNYCDN